MKCVKCGKKAIYKNFCEEHFVEHYLKKVEETIKKYKMFDKNDKILVAVSGGKDSTSLAYALHLLGYNFEGLYINLEIENYSNICEERVKEFFKLINKKLNIVYVSEYGVKVRGIKNKPVCSVCGTIKRYIMNKFAYENGFNVIATAHNLGDEIAFYFMNLYSGNLEYISKQKPVLEGYGKFVKKVKPLVYFTEKENLLFVLVNKLPYCNIECPYSKIGQQKQLEWKKIIYNIESKNPNFMIKLYKTNLKLFNFKNESEIYECKICGYPTSSKDGICSFCKIREYFKSGEK